MSAALALVFAGVLGALEVVAASSAHERLGGDSPKPLGLTHANLNPRLLATQYAVRGRLLDRAKELEAAGREVCKCNIGNPHALGAKPLRWIRAVLALCVDTDLLAHAEAAVRAKAW